MSRPISSCRASKIHFLSGILVFTLGFLGFSNQCRATDLFYTDRTAFENALGADLKTEGFESFSIGIVSTVLQANGFSAHALSGSLFGISSGYLSGGYPTDGNQWAWQTGAVIYQFDQPTRAFGADFTDFGDVPAGYSLQVGLDSRTPFQVATSPRPDLNFLFFGVISDTLFHSVTVADSYTNETFGTDKLNFTVETVPEPSTWALGLVSSIVASVLISRRQSL